MTESPPPTRSESLESKDLLADQAVAYSQLLSLLLNIERLSATRTAGIIIYTHFFFSPEPSWFYSLNFILSFFFIFLFIKGTEY